METPLLPKNDFIQQLMDFDTQPKNVEPQQILEQPQYTIHLPDEQIRVESLMELPLHSMNLQEQNHQFKVLLYN